MMSFCVCVCVYRNMNVIIPPHPTPAVTDDERAVPVAVPVCVQEHERYHPTPPHPTPPSGSYLACGGKQNQSLVAVRTFKNLTAASDWFWRVLQESYCRKWLILTAASDWNLTAASDGWASRTIPKIDIKLPKTDKHGKPVIFIYIYIYLFHRQFLQWTSDSPNIPKSSDKNLAQVGHGAGATPKSGASAASAVPWLPVSPSFTMFLVTLRDFSPGLSLVYNL